MKSFILTVAALIAALVGVATPANAALDFSYMFGGNTFSGLFIGSLQSDNNTFNISGVKSLAVNGTNFDFDTTSLFATDSFIDVAAKPRVTLDGTVVDFGLSATKGNVTNTAVFSSGSQFSNIVLGGNSLVAATPGFTGGAPFVGSFSPGSFSAGISAAPEPGTWALMILGFGLVGGAFRYQRRLRRPAMALATA